MSHVSKDAVISEFKNMYFSAKKWHEDAKDEVAKARAESCIATLIELKLRIDKMPSSEEESFEWCTDCKEYDHEAHCCHRWSKMIRKTVDEMQIVRCKDCKHRDPEDKKCDCGHDIEWQLPRDDYWYCADGERKEDE